MKKTLLKTMSLLLVLVLVIGMLPMALAAGNETELDPGDDSSQIGGNTGSDDNNTTERDPADNETEIDPGDDNTTGGNTGDKDDNETEIDPGEGEDPVDPNPGEGDGEDETVTLAGLTISGATTVAVGGSITLTLTPSPANASVAGAVWTQSATDAGKVTFGTQTSNSITVTGNTVGTVKVKASVGETSAEYNITVTGDPVITNIPDVVVAVGEKVNVTPSVKNLPAGSASPKFKFTVSQTDTFVQADTVNTTDGTYGLGFTGKKAGKATVTVACTNIASVPTATFNITVSAGKVECSSYSLEASAGAYHQLKPTYTGTNASNVTFTYSAGSKIGSVTVSSTGLVELTGSKPAAIVVNITAKNGTEVVATGTTCVSFYVEHNRIDVTMVDGNRTLDFGDYTDTEERERLDSLMTEGYSSSSYADKVYFTDLSTNEGRLNYLETTSGNLANVVFTPGTYGSASFSYYITPGATFDNLPLCQGGITIRYGETDGDIEYSTTYNKSVTFTERDFYEFWDDTKNTSDLDYVRFTSLQPTYGKLYTRNTTSTSYLAQTTDKFYYGSQSSSSYKRLGEVTYVPNSTKTNSYDVTIPFTAYGEKSTETASGYIVIHMNDGDGSTITSRGIFFGSKYQGTQTYADLIADNFESKTDEDLEYVIFDLPSVKQARLFSSVPTDFSGNTLVAQGKHLVYGTKLYYNSRSSTTNSLENTALIPAAGFTGTITLEYTAYSEDGDEKRDGTISFKVTSKSSSSVFSDVGTTYSWAADSVDFLYYEGIAQGSNNRYNPKANITRGDFMLMLYRAFLADDHASDTITSNFTDVVKGTSDYSQETYHAVGVAKALGIAQGTNNKYNPKANITREEAMTLIHRTLDKTNRDLDYSSNVSASSFKDYSKISTYAKTAIGDLVSHGVIVGSNDRVNPQNPITRAEMACILHRVITY